MLDIDIKQYTELKNDNLAQVKTRLLHCVAYFNKLTITSKK